MNCELEDLKLEKSKKTEKLKTLCQKKVSNLKIC